MKLVSRSSIAELSLNLFLVTRNVVTKYVVLKHKSG